MAEAYPHEGAFRGYGGLSDRTQQEIDVVGVDHGRQLNTRKLALVMPEHHAAVGGDAVDPPIARDSESAARIGGANLRPLIDL